MFNRYRLTQHASAQSSSPRPWPHRFDRMAFDRMKVCSALGYRMFATLFFISLSPEIYGSIVFLFNTNINYISGLSGTTVSSSVKALGLFDPGLPHFYRAAGL